MGRVWRTIFILVIVLGVALNVYAFVDGLSVTGAVIDKDTIIALKNMTKLKTPI